MPRKVRVGSLYRFVAVGVDAWSPNPLAPTDGETVRVINLHGAPKANTMGHCYVEGATSGEFCGLVLTNSLTPVTLQ
jgi:hypothetical protein